MNITMDLGNWTMTATIITLWEVQGKRLSQRWAHFYKCRKLLFQGLWAWLYCMPSRVGGRQAVTLLRLVTVILLAHRVIVTSVTYVITHYCRCHVTGQVSFLCLSKRACAETAAPCQTNSMMCPRALIKLHNPQSNTVIGKKKTCALH